MTELTLKLKDEFIKRYGEHCLRQYLEKQIEYLNALQFMDDIEEQIKNSGIDYEAELDSIREEAWKEYKKDFLNCPGT